MLKKVERERNIWTRCVIEVEASEKERMGECRAKPVEKDTRAGLERELCEGWVVMQIGSG